MEFSIYKLSFSEYIYRLPIVLLLDESSFPICLYYYHYYCYDDDDFWWLAFYIHTRAFSRNMYVPYGDFLFRFFFCISRNRKRQRKNRALIALYENWLSRLFFLLPDTDFLDCCCPTVIHCSFIIIVLLLSLQCCIRYISHLSSATKKYDNNCRQYRISLIEMSS